MLGIHCSIAGGINNAFNEVEEYAINTFQIFTKNQRQWQEKTIDTEEGQLFKTKLSELGIKTAFSHAIYLINLASSDRLLWEKSVNSITSEIIRCHALGLAFTILHPGSAINLSETEGIKKIAKGIKSAFKETANSTVKILLETTAGQGSNVGYKFEQLKSIMDEVENTRVGICFDTCHAFAAGYDIRTQMGVEDTFGELEKKVGLNHLDAIHLNDSKGDLGSRLDRHEHIGQGKIGLTPFRYIMNQFNEIPKVIETPKKDNMDGENLIVLRDLVQ